MKKNVLLAPGPTPVPPEALMDMALPIIHHREPEFKPIFEECLEGLKYLFQTERDVVILASSGTGAMEAAVTSFLRTGDKAIFVNGGKFGERWGKILKAYGCVPIEVKVEWGKAVDPAVIEKLLDEDPEIRAVYFQASETSTAVKHPAKEIAAITAKRPGVICVADAITATGVFDLPMDAWGLDIVVTGSQKALMLPPGLGFIASSEKADAFLETANIPHYYFDIKLEKKKLADKQTAWTPAVSLIVGLRKVLAMIKEEGLENVHKRTARFAKAAREGAKAIGLELFAPDSPSDALTAVKIPDGIDGLKVKKILRESYAVTVAGGQDEAKGKIVRLAHLGYAGTFDVITGLSALEMALADAGYEFEMGKGVAKAMEILREGA
ncbi:MAG: aminotransferase [Deltaproteobacteria bacterium]|nr:MAG: aminotransferase [Deltaproteobacteria bacterium]